MKPKDSITDPLEMSILCQEGRAEAIIGPIPLAISSITHTDYHNVVGTMVITPRVLCDITPGHGECVRIELRWHPDLQRYGLFVFLYSDPDLSTCEVGIWRNAEIIWSTSQEQGNEC